MTLPENLELVAAKPEYLSGFKNYKEYGKTYVAYISDHDPKTQLYRIELALQECIEKRMGYMIYVSGTEKNDIEEILKKLNYKYAVYSDVNSEFKTANGIEDLYYAGFIVDKKGAFITAPMINFRR
ncbi:hypothetical protein [Roseivirga echinicomitans]